MTATEHDVVETDVLIRKVDGHLAALRAGLRGADLELAERLAAALRELVTDTAGASAVDRARVRAAVHYFVLRRESRGFGVPVRSLAAARLMVNRIVLHLNRPELTVDHGRPELTVDHGRPEPTTGPARPDPAG